MFALDSRWTVTAMFRRRWTLSCLFVLVPCVLVGCGDTHGHRGMGQGTVDRAAPVHHGQFADTSRTGIAPSVSRGAANDERGGAPVAAVPEPSTLFLVGSGVMLTAMWRRGRRGKAR